MSNISIDLRLGDFPSAASDIPDESVDLIVTSPPYNKKSSKRTKHEYDAWKGGGHAISYGDFDDDIPEDKYQQWQIECLNECMRILKTGGSCFYNHKNRLLDKVTISPYEWILKSNARVKQEITWNRMGFVQIDKVRFFPKTEKIFWLIKGAYQPKFNGDCATFTDVWDILPVQGENRNGHPAPFPLEIPRRCILATTEPGDVVFDPFVGSGTTLVACIQLGRNGIGMERYAPFLKIAEESTEKEKNKMLRSQGIPIPSRISNNVTQESIFG